MLHLYDRNHLNKAPLTEYKDYKIVKVLSTADKTLTFSTPSMVEEEGYIRTPKDEFVIKSVNVTNKGWYNVTAALNVEDLEGKEWKSFETIETTIEDALNLAFVGTGWIVKTSSITKKRTLRLTNTNAWNILQQARKTYRCEIKLDSINKTVTIVERLGSDKGVYFIDSLNLISLNKQSNSNDFYTRLIALGKTTTTGEGENAVENTLEVVVENHQYSNKVKTLIWKDERYTDEESLREDATYKLDEISKPYKAYTVSVLDLANINPKYKDILSYELGDTITIISNGFRDKQRIVKLVEYPEQPEKNSCELGNIKLTFEEVQKEQKEVAETVSNITSDNGTISESAIKEVVKILVKSLSADEINAIKINVGKLEATITEINTAYIDKAYVEKLLVNYATIENLKAALAQIGVLEADYATIKELLAGNLTGENIQAGSITGDLLNMLTVFITDANILDVTAGKITSGTLDTSKVTIQSENGDIIISGSTQQFKDRMGRVRLQIGQDAQGNFTFSLFDESGIGVLIDSTGIKEGAISEGLIKESMISDGAVGGKKINWSSFVEEFNKDTNTSTINSSKIIVDGTNQSINVHLNEIESNIGDINSKKMYRVEIISSNGNIFKNGNINTVLSARVYSWDKNITDEINASRFIWTRTSNNAEEDKIWNDSHFGGTKEITVTTDDVYSRATFNVTILDEEGRKIN